MLKITVNGNKTINCKSGDNLFKLLSDAGFTFVGNCGGRGACNRCLVYDVINNEYLRSCTYSVSADMNIRISENNTNVLTEYEYVEGEEGDSHFTPWHPRPYGVAVDLGTTTVAMELVDLRSGKTCGSYTFLNPQIAHGSDVISRIQLGSTRDGLETLRDEVVKKLDEGCCQMLYLFAPDYQGMSYDDVCAVTEPVRISRMIISGNTTMLAIVSGLTLENLGGAPFEVKNPDMITMEGSFFFGHRRYQNTKVTCLPNLSAFVGADALSGAVSRGLNDATGWELFVDLGTNGEIILTDGKSGLGTSCACGPAFEGMFRKQSINGSNIFDMMNMLKVSGKLSEDGVLADEYIEKGYIMSGGTKIDMDMVRNFLLAKSAIGAAIETAMNMAKIESKDLKKVHISGGFGYSLNLSNAIALGMFPESFMGKTEFVGNTSLAGAHLSLVKDNFISSIDEFKGKLKPVNLAEVAEFQDIYYRHMNLKTWRA